MAKILPGQLRARPTSRPERLLDISRGLPRTVAELRQSLLMLGMYRQVGWQRSVRAGMPVDASGHPVPWFSYPALEWLRGALEGNERVFEFGAGHSTIWFSRRAASVVSVEHDEGWIGHLGGRVGANVTLVHRSCGGDEDWAPEGDPYAGCLDEYPPGHFDVVVVDGMARNRCAEAAVRQGARLVILDNADRPAYHPGADALQRARYRRIDFVGPSVVQGVFSCTAAFAQELPAGVTTSPGYPHFWGY